MNLGIFGSFLRPITLRILWQMMPLHMPTPLTFPPSIYFINVYNYHRLLLIIYLLIYSLLLFSLEYYLLFSIGSLPPSSLPLNPIGNPVLTQACDSVCVISRARFPAGIIRLPIGCLHLLHTSGHRIGLGSLRPSPHTLTTQCSKEIVGIIIHIPNCVDVRLVTCVRMEWSI